VPQKVFRFDEAAQTLQPKSASLIFPFLAHHAVQQILGFEVPVDYPIKLEICEGREDLSDVP
jgi:hypothetical protein